MKRFKRIIVLLMIVMIVSISTVSQALLLFRDDVIGIIRDGHFFPTYLEGGLFFCIQPGGHFTPSEMMTKAEDAEYPAGSFIPKNGDYLCEECFPTLEKALPWENNTKYYYRYEPGQVFSVYQNPDAAYVLAEMTERGQLVSWDTAYGIWNAKLSYAKRGDAQIVGESKAYDTFFQLIHGGYTSNDMFESMVSTSGGNTLNGVSQGNGTYTLGPYTINYPEGTYNGENKFSWIKTLKAFTDVGELAISIATASGESIDIGELGEKGSQSLNGKPFYITFHSTEATQVYVEAEIEYLEHCEAVMTEYVGLRVCRNWLIQINGKHEHSRWIPNMQWGDSDGDGKYEWEDHGHDVPYYRIKRRYMAFDVMNAPVQVLMALSGQASKVRKSVVRYFSGGVSGGSASMLEDAPHLTPLKPEGGDPENPPPPIPGDLTMKLGGTVFIDKEQVTGKLYEGNNLLDSGEGLPGTEVYLHEVGRGVIAKTLTNDKGEYLFTKLNSQKKYFVEFVYNGMLYTNVERLAGNATNISKATEEAQGHGGNRQNFNDIFKEIGSNPHNYKSPSRGNYNQVFLQEQIADTFKRIASNYGGHGNSDEEVFAYDNRIHAYSTEIYPLYNSFTPDSNKGNIAGDDYDALYYDAYDQTHINLGIKARPTFDLALYKDVMKATLNINGQEEVYTYDARKDWNNEGFSFGVREDYYFSELRNKYILNKSTNIKTKETINEGEYSHEYRTEEIINGNNTNSVYRGEDGESGWLNNKSGDDGYRKTMFGNDKNYAWRDINSQLNDPERLQIHVTYKIAIRNQSNVVGSVTEIVDYYDENYQFESAYMGDKDGNPISGTVVEANQTSIYGEETRMGKDGKWTVDGGKRGYKTIYFRPTEKKLHPNDKEQYIYVTYGLINPEETLIREGLPEGKTFYTYNLAEINGYKTYGMNTNETESLGLIDRDSNPGNFNPGAYEMGKTPLEDDTSKAPAYAYNIRTSRTLEGHVFEDMLSKDATVSKDKNGNAVKHVVDVAKNRFGDGIIGIGENKDKAIAGVKVELVELKEQVNDQGQKEEKLVVRSTTYTDNEGWYGFGAFIPGKYTIRFTYGADDQTALTKESQYIEDYIDQYNAQFEKENQKTFEERYLLSYGIINDTSYTGQDYQATSFADASKQDSTLSLDVKSYDTDNVLKKKYETDNESAIQNTEMKVNEINQTPQKTLIKKYQKLEKTTDGEMKEVPYYWFEDGVQEGSDATDDVARRAQVIAYAKEEYGKQIVNHKAEVFNSYINQNTLRQQESEDNEFDEYTQAQPMEKNVDTKEKNRDLVDELERRNYMYAYTPEINVEVEYTTKQILGNQNANKAQTDPDCYEYKITGVDFGMEERPRSQLTMDQDIANIKVIASDGRTILELENEDGSGNIKLIVDNGKNYQWLEAGILKNYDRGELLNIILDDELLSGSKLEVTYNMTLTNNSEQEIDHVTNESVTTRAKTIINYVANNLNFDLKDNDDLWEVVKKEDIQTNSHATWVNSEKANSKTKRIDLSTQTTVLKATNSNPLTKPLLPGQSVTSTLTLKKTLSAESAADDLSYSNLSEIVEIDNGVGRYDHGAIPGNQSLTEQPREHDTSGSSRYNETDKEAGTKNVITRYPQDGKIIITPPTGETKIYYLLSSIVAVILLTGIVTIKKFVIDKKTDKEE